MSLTDSNEENNTTPTGKKRGPKPKKITKTHKIHTADEIIAIAEDYLVEAQQGKIQIAEQFYAKHHIYRDKWNQWCQKFEYVAEIQKIIKPMLISSTYKDFPECPRRAEITLKTQNGWSDIEEIAEQVAKVVSYQELKAKIDGSI